MRYILSIDQSTATTKAVIFDENGSLLARHDVAHRQIVDDKGWIEHDPLEIWKNLLAAVRGVVDKGSIDRDKITCLALCNQRETAVVWDRITGMPLYNAIVWQCGRGDEICRRIAGNGVADVVKQRTGGNLSPYFSAAKFAWILENVPGCKKEAEAGQLCCSTIDSWLVYKLTDGAAIKTDYSNASRTQLLNLDTLRWDPDICDAFGVSTDCLPEVCHSDSLFGYTNLNGFLGKKIPVHGVIGDSHGALLSQGCVTPGKVKATYGTGSSVMMNTGDTVVRSDHLVTSLAWGLLGKVSYVLEGNLNYTGAVAKWLVETLELFTSPNEVEKYARQARHVDGLYLVPAFSGFGAPHWNSRARAMLCGMDRGCGKREIARAAEECIAYQITDILRLMEHDSGIDISELRVDGGATRDHFLMQFQADIADAEIMVSHIEELSAMGAAYAAGSAMNIYDPDSITNRPPGSIFSPALTGELRDKWYDGWQKVVQKTLLD